MSGKKKFKINFFDIVIVIVVIAIGAVVYAMTNKEVVQETKTIRYTIELVNQNEGFTENINVGDDIYDNIKNYYMGKVVSVEAVPYKKLISDSENGRVLESTIDGRETAILVLEANVTENGPDFKVGGSYVVKAGKEVAVKGKGYAGEGYILTVER